MTHYEQIKKIANHYGFRHQGRKLAEECGELAVAILKFLNGEVGRSAVIEEMADVQIMTEQMQYLMNIDRSTLRKAIEQKMQRQLGRMKNERPLDKSGKSSIIENYHKLKAENEWYQELYDKARREQIAWAEEAEALRAENDRLRAELQKRRGA
jgi:NTP pyrophosphatase (non-canonical NTP hydrolase)